MQPVAVAAQFIGITEYPADRAAHLLDHREQAATGIVYIDEVGNDEIAAGTRERLRQDGEFRRGSSAPGATMNENRDGSIWRAAAMDVQAFARRRSIDEAQRLAEPRPRRRA